MTASEAQIRASLKYKTANYKRVPFDLPKSDYEKLKGAADAAGEGVNTYIKRAVIARMESEGLEPITANARKGRKSEGQIEE